MTGKASAPDGIRLDEYILDLPAISLAFRETVRGSWGLENILEIQNLNSSRTMPKTNQTY